MPASSRLLRNLGSFTIHGMDEVIWPAQWLRGVLRLMVLAVIAEGPTYGYEITQRLQRAGLGHLKGGTLYPLLRRLAEEGAVVAQWHESETGPGRKYFYLTRYGVEQLEQERCRWIEFTNRTTTLLDEATAENGE
ncbi:hypothetical protein GCM10027444_35840 [Actinopolyspora lacussalsi]